MKRVVRILFTLGLAPFVALYHLILSPVYLLWVILATYGWAFGHTKTFKEALAEVEWAAFHAF